MTDQVIKTGTCLCGSVTFKTDAPLDTFGACHCSMCRKWGGGPYLEVECKGAGVKIEGEENVSVFKSSDWAERGFCKNCGTHLFYRVAAMNQYHVPLGLFGDAVSPEFNLQVFIDKKPDYYSFNQETKNFTEAEVFEMFAAADPK